MFLPQNIFTRVRHLGLSFSSYAVRAAVVDTSGKMVSQAEVIANQLLINGEQVNKPELIQALQTIKQQLNLNSFYAACNIPEKLAFSREYTLPHLTDAEISEAIKWQLGTIFPFNPEDLYTDWRLISRTDSETKIVITAVNKQFIDDLVACCFDVGIKPISFESSASALAKALKNNSAYSIIIEIDNFGSSATLIENGVSSLTITTNFATATDSQNLLEDIVLSLKQLIKRLHNLNPQAQADFYCSGEKALPELISALSAQLNQPINQLYANQIPGAFHTAYIEAAENIEAPESNKTINLLPASIEQQYHLETDISQAKTVAKFGIIISLIAFIFALSLFIVSTIMVNDSIKYLASVPEPPPPPPEVNLGLYLQKAQKITQLQPVKYFPHDQFAALNSILTADNLRQYSYDAAKKTITLTLEAVDRQQLFDLKNTLEDTNLFSQIFIPLSALNSDKSDSVSIVLTIKSATP